MAFLLDSKNETVKDLPAGCDSPAFFGSRSDSPPFHGGDGGLGIQLGDEDGDIEIGMEFGQDQQQKRQTEDALTSFTSVTQAGAQSFSNSFFNDVKPSGKALATSTDTRLDHDILERARSQFRIPSDTIIPEETLQPLRPLFYEEEKEFAVKGAVKDRSKVWLKVSEEGLDGRLYALGRQAIKKQVKIVNESVTFGKIFDELEILGKMHSDQTPVPWQEIHHRVLTCTTCDQTLESGDSVELGSNSTIKKSKAERGKAIVEKMVPIVNVLPMSEEEREKYALPWLIECMRPRILYCKDINETIAMLKSEEGDLQSFMWETKAQAEKRYWRLIDEAQERAISMARSQAVVSNANSTNNRNSANSMNDVNSANSSNSMNNMNGVNPVNSANGVNRVNSLDRMNGVSDMDSGMSAPVITKQILDSVNATMKNVTPIWKDLTDLDGMNELLRKSESRKRDSISSSNSGSELHPLGSKKRQRPHPPGFHSDATITARRVLPEGEGQPRTFCQFMYDQVDEVRQSSFPKVRYEEKKQGALDMQGSKYGSAIGCLLNHLDAESARTDRQKSSNLILLLWSLIYAGLHVDILDNFVSSTVSSYNVVPLDSSETVEEQMRQKNTERAEIDLEHHLHALMAPLVEKRCTIREYVTMGRILSKLLEAEGLSCRKFHCFLDGVNGLKINAPKEIALFVIRSTILQEIKAWNPRLLSGILQKPVKNAFLTFPHGQAELAHLCETHDWEARKKRDADRRRTCEEENATPNEAATDETMSGGGSSACGSGGLKESTLKSHKPLCVVSSTMSVKSGASSEPGPKRPRLDSYSTSCDPEKSIGREVVVKTETQPRDCDLDSDTMRARMLFLGETRLDYRASLPANRSQNWMNSVRSKKWMKAPSNPFIDKDDDSVCGEDGMSDMKEPESVSDDDMEIGMDFEVPFAGASQHDNEGPPQPRRGSENPEDEVDVEEAERTEEILGEKIDQFESVHGKIFWEAGIDDKQHKAVLDMALCSNTIMPGLEALWARKHGFASEQVQQKKPTGKCPSLPITMLQLKAFLLSFECVVALESERVPEDPTVTGYRPPANYAATCSRLQQVCADIKRECKGKASLEYVIEECKAYNRFHEKKCSAIFDHIDPDRDEILIAAENFIARDDTTAAQCKTYVKEQIDARWIRLKALQPEMWTSLAQQTREKEDKGAHFKTAHARLNRTP